MNSVTVKKAELLATLQENRASHRETFEKAQVIYREQMISELDRAITEAREGRAIKRAFALPVPEDHTDDFDTVIQMLRWEVEDEVELQYQEFRQYVLNEWGWARTFAANTQSYLVS